MSLEMEAISNEWQTRMERIQQHRLQYPNYEPHTSAYDPMVPERNFFQRYPYMRQYVNKPVIEETMNTLASTSVPVKFTAKVFIFYIWLFGCWSIFWILVGYYGVQPSTAGNLVFYASLAILLYLFFY